MTGYSGTVSAAMKATLMGIPAIAISLVTAGSGEHYAEAATDAVRIVRGIILRGMLAA